MNMFDELKEADMMYNALLILRKRNIISDVDYNECVEKIAGLYGCIN